MGGRMGTETCAHWKGYIRQSTDSHTSISFCTDGTLNIYTILQHGQEDGHIDMRPLEGIHQGSTDLHTSISFCTDRTLNI
jgi:hypothetical protein